MLYVAAASFIGSTAFTAGSALPASLFLMQQPAVQMAKVSPVLIGIAADSGCGKSTFMRHLTSIFGGESKLLDIGRETNMLMSDMTTDGGSDALQTAVLDAAVDPAAGVLDLLVPPR
jgi:hypothetical protein